MSRIKWNYRGNSELPVKGIGFRRGRPIYPSKQPPFKEKRSSSLKSLMVDYLRHTTIHSLSYLVIPNFNNFERTFWTLMFFLSVFGTFYTSWETWSRYGGTVTYIESNRFPLTEVPFPSVSICDATMVDWQRALQLNESDLPEPFDKSKNEALNLLKRLGFVGFGDFDYLDQLRLQNYKFDTLKSVNLSDLLLKVRRPCEEMFTGFCWWKDHEWDCCSLFELQKTDRGFCWAFNSDTSEESKEISMRPRKNGQWVDKMGHSRPRASVAKGPWSGLRVEVTPMSEDSLPPERNISSTNVMVIVSDPRAVPQGTYVTVPEGMLGNLAVWGDSIRTKPEVRRLPQDIKDCLFEDENKGQDFRKEYIQDNCFYQCYRDYAIKYCGCIPDFLFPDSFKYPMAPCNVDGLMCLSEWNLPLNYLRPASQTQYNEEYEGMICDCPKDCNSHEYVTELFSPFNTGNDSKIILDVYFRLSYCVLYQTGITNDWLNTLVSFGGIAGLFLGASLLSCVELIYFLTIRLYRILLGNKNQRTNQKLIKTKNRIRNKVNVY